jgi:endonuclease/exonuclease/phosphatase family metal-dependent hydrolase
MRVLTWNLFHGRAKPNAGRDLRKDFETLIASWDWDVGLFQEVPPWWRFADEQHTALTGRNTLLPIRRALATRWPDVLKSNGGGANVIAVRNARIIKGARKRLRIWPERRVMHVVQLDSGIWVANLHAQVWSDERACADMALAGHTVLRWAGFDAPVILGGDTNLRRPRVEGFTRAGGFNVDHVLVRGALRPMGKTTTPERGALSDHRPVILELEDLRR